MLFIPKIQKQIPVSPDITEEIDAPLLPIDIPEEKEAPIIDEGTVDSASDYFSAPIIETHPTGEALNLTDPAPKTTKGE